MSNANRNMLGTVTHAIERKMRTAGEGFMGHCGTVARHATTDRSLVTCKRCLASLAKRDRAFQRKARGFFTLAIPVHDADASGPFFKAVCHGFPVPPLGNRRPTCSPCLAARAIAREEG